MTDKLPNADNVIRFSHLGSGNQEEIKGIYNPRELFIDTVNQILYIHDGKTAGGFPLAKADLSNVNLTDLLGLLTNIDPAKIKWNSFGAIYMSSISGKNANKGLNPQLPKLTFDAALSQVTTEYINCVDYSSFTMYPIGVAMTGVKQVNAPMATFTLTSNTTIHAGSSLTCAKLVNNGSWLLTIEEGAYLSVDSIITTNPCITGAGSVILTNLPNPVFTNTFTGTYNLKYEKHELFEPYDSVNLIDLNKKQNHILLNGATITINNYHTTLVNEMKKYLSTNGAQGVKTLTTAQSKGITGEYFIYDDGATTFKAPLYMTRTKSVGVPYYGNKLYDGGLNTANFAFPQDVLVTAFVVGSNGQTARIIISDPTGAELTNEQFFAHVASMASSGWCGFIIPAGYSYRFSAFVAGQNCKVYGLTASGNNFTLNKNVAYMRIY